MVDEDGCFKGYHCTKYVSKVVNHKLKIPFNFHMLRHTHATMLYEKGAPIKDIQDRLGHSSFQTTMNTYVSNTKISQEKTQNIIENLLQFAA